MGFSFAACLQRVRLHDTHIAGRQAWGQPGSSSCALCAPYLCKGNRAIRRAACPPPHHPGGASIIAAHSVNGARYPGSSPQCGSGGSIPPVAGSANPPRVHCRHARRERVGLHLPHPGACSLAGITSSQSVISVSPRPWPPIAQLGPWSCGGLSSWCGAPWDRNPVPGPHRGSCARRIVAKMCRDELLVLQYLLREVHTCCRPRTGISLQKTVTCGSKLFNEAVA